MGLGLGQPQLLYGGDRCVYPLWHVVFVVGKEYKGTWLAGISDEEGSRMG